jgi:predicted O-methyltransferase YrrM
MIHGMCSDSTLLTVDNNPALVAIAKKYLGQDSRVRFVVDEGENIIEGLSNSSMGLIFADAWRGKFNHRQGSLALLKVGGLCIIDDMCIRKVGQMGTQIKPSVESHSYLEMKVLE